MASEIYTLNVVSGYSTGVMKNCAVYMFLKKIVVVFEKIDPELQCEHKIFHTPVELEDQKGVST